MAQRAQKGWRTVGMGVPARVCRNLRVLCACNGVRPEGSTRRRASLLPRVSIISIISITSIISTQSPFARAAAPVPAWQVGEASLRTVFLRASHDDFALCTLPAEAGGQPVAALKAESGGAARPVRVVWADDERLQALVDCRGLPENAVVTVYGIVGEKRAAVEPGGFADPLPLRVAALRTVGQDPPATLEDLKLLALRPGARTEFFAVSGFDVVAEGIGRYAKGGGYDRPLALLRLTTWIFVPQEARYVFALTGDNAAWLQIDGVEAVGQGYSRGRPTRQESRPIALAAGLHRLIVDTAVRHAYSLGVLWRAADADAGAAEPVLVTGGGEVEGRVERREGDLHVFARVQRGGSYRFQGVPALFSPLTLQDGSVCWSGGELTYDWRIDGTPVGTGRRFDTVWVTTNGAPAAIELTVLRTNDNVTASATVTLPAATVPSAEYRLSSALVGAPAVCYGEDPVVPEIHVRATAPDPFAYTVRTELVGRDGRPVVSETPLALTRSWGRVALPPAEADAFREIRWQVLHAGVAVDTGRWVFDAAPFEGLPDGVHGVSLLRGGAGLTLIARRASQGESNLFKGLRRGQKLLFLDGFLTPQGVADRASAEQMDRALASGPDSLSVAYQRIGLRAIEADGSPQGVSQLAPLAFLRELLPVDVVLLAPDLSGARDGETPEVFERRLAAFAGALSEAGKTQLILVAPPAFDVLPGCGCEPGPEPCAHARAGRLYAEIVYRVADAYGLSVADLYTPFALDEGAAPLLGGGVLTPRGLQKATEVFVRVLYSPDR